MYVILGDLGRLHRGTTVVNGHVSEACGKNHTVVVASAANQNCFYNLKSQQERNRDLNFTLFTVGKFHGIWRQNISIPFNHRQHLVQFTVDIIV